MLRSDAETLQTIRSIQKISVSGSGEEEGMQPCGKLDLCLLFKERTHGRNAIVAEVAGGQTGVLA